MAGLIAEAELYSDNQDERAGEADGCTSSEPFGQKGLGFKRVTGSSDFLQATLF